MRLEALSKVTAYKGEPEMSAFESAFLCGCIRRFKPHKILEIGIAGGGTGAIISYCMTKMGIEGFELYSIDCSERFYRDNSLPSGFLSMEMDDYLKHNKKTYLHEYYLDNVACSYLSKIGGEIDFVVLDTSHRLPGEILDLITLIPYLKNGCCVVLHDLILSHIEKNGEYCKFASSILLSSIIGEKYLNNDVSRPHNIPNIGAVVINDYTRKRIIDLFLSLLVPWNYMPNEKHLKEYRNAIGREYDKELSDLFEEILLMNADTLRSVKK